MAQTLSSEESLKGHLNYQHHCPLLEVVVKECVCMTRDGLCSKLLTSKLLKTFCAVVVTSAVLSYHSRMRMISVLVS